MPYIASSKITIVDALLLLVHVQPSFQRKDLIYGDTKMCRIAIILKQRILFKILNERRLDSPVLKRLLCQGSLSRFVAFSVLQKGAADYVYFLKGEKVNSANGKCFVANQTKYLV